MCVCDCVHVYTIHASVWSVWVCLCVCLCQCVCVCVCLCACVHRCMCLCECVFMWVSEWVSEWVSKCVSVWVCVCVSVCVWVCVCYCRLEGLIELLVGWWLRLVVGGVTDSLCAEPLSVCVCVCVRVRVCVCTSPVTGVPRCLYWYVGRDDEVVFVVWECVGCWQEGVKVAYW
jgi:hypothetical protein